MASRRAGAGSRRKSNKSVQPKPRQAQARAQSQSESQSTSAATLNFTPLPLPPTATTAATPGPQVAPRVGKLRPALLSPDRTWEVRSLQTSNFSISTTTVPRSRRPVDISRDWTILTPNTMELQSYNLADRIKASGRRVATKKYAACSPPPALGKTAQRTVQRASVAGTERRQSQHPPPNLTMKDLKFDTGDASNRKRKAIHLAGPTHGASTAPPPSISHPKDDTSLAVLQSEESRKLKDPSASALAATHVEPQDKDVKRARTTDPVSPPTLTENEIMQQGDTALVRLPTQEKLPKLPLTEPCQKEGKPVVTGTLVQPDKVINSHSTDTTPYLTPSAEVLPFSGTPVNCSQEDRGSGDASTLTHKDECSFAITEQPQREEATPSAKENAGEEPRLAARETAQSSLRWASHVEINPEPLISFNLAASVGEAGSQQSLPEKTNHSGLRALTEGDQSQLSPDLVQSSEASSSYQTPMSSGDNKDVTPPSSPPTWLCGFIDDTTFVEKVKADLDLRCQSKMTTTFDRQVRRIRMLLEIAIPPAHDEALFLTGEEAAAQMTPGRYCPCPIVTTGQQPLPLQTTADFLSELYDDEAKVFVQDPTIKLSTKRSAVRAVTVSKLKQRFSERTPASQAWNCLELATHMEDGLRPSFLNNEDCRLLTKLKHPTQGDRIGRRGYDPGWKEVEKWALLAQAGALTEPHQDSHGYSTYITLNQGLFGFGWLCDPSASDREAWNRHPSTFQGGQWRYLVLHPGQTVFFPGGTVHFVFRLLSAGDTLAFGGHVLRCSQIVSWAKTLLAEKLSPQISNEDLTVSAPAYFDRVERFVRQALAGERKQRGEADRWGGAEACEEFLRLKAEFAKCTKVRK